MNLWPCIVMRGWGGNRNGAGLNGSQTVKHAERVHPHLSTVPTSAGTRVSCPLGMSFECKMLHWLTW